MQNWGRFGSEKGFIEWIKKISFPEIRKMQSQIKELQKQVAELNSLIYRNDQEDGSTI